MGTWERGERQRERRLTSAICARVQLIALVLLDPAKVACAGSPGSADLVARVLRVRSLLRLGHGDVVVVAVDVAVAVAVAVNVGL